MVMAVTIFDRHVVTDLPTDPVTVVVSRRHFSDQNLIDVLQEDAATIIAIQVFIVGSIAVERQVFNDQMIDLFAGDQRE